MEGPPAHSRSMASRARTTNSMPPGEPARRGIHEHRGGIGPAPSRTGRAPLARTKQRKDPFSAGPRKRGYSLDRPVLASRCEPRGHRLGPPRGAHPASRSISITGRFEPFIEAPPRSAEHDRRQPALPAPRGRSSCEGWSSIDGHSSQAAPQRRQPTRRSLHALTRGTHRLDASCHCIRAGW